MNSIKALIIGTATVAFAATPVLAEKARELQDLIGKDVPTAENALFSREFKHISSHRNTQGYVYSYWWDDKDDKCVYVGVYERTNLVESIKDAKDQDCGYHKNDNTAAVVGVGLGAALLGALIGGGKSHHEEDKQYNNNDRAEFDRGYRDGLYSGSYHNYSRSDAYSHGYEQGVDEREANLRSHKRRGGYNETVAFADLQGARVNSASDSLSQRGFRQVDNFTSGDTRYSIQWRSASRQCLQMTISDGKVYDIRDIGSHPKCR